jgi:hypothetical protein
MNRLVRIRLVLPLLAIAALAAPAALATAPVAQAAPDRSAPAKKYSIYGSCDNGKPYKAASHCRYDKSRLFRGTFVFESHVGKRPLKSCFRIYGAPPVGGGHACVKLGPLAYKAYPFKVSGVRQKFAAKVSWFVKKKGDDSWAQVGSSYMKVNP